MQTVLGTGQCGRVGAALVHVTFEVEPPARWTPPAGGYQLAKGLWARATEDDTFEVVTVAEDEAGRWWLTEGEVERDAFRQPTPLWRFPASLRTRVVADTLVRRIAAPEHEGRRSVEASDQLVRDTMLRVAEAGVPLQSFFASWLAPAAPEAGGAPVFHAMLRRGQDHVRRRRLRNGLEAVAEQLGVDLRPCPGCKEPVTESIPVEVWERLKLPAPVAPQPVAPAAFKQAS